MDGEFARTNSGDATVSSENAISVREPVPGTCTVTVDMPSSVPMVGGSSTGAVRLVMSKTRIDALAKPPTVIDAGRSDREPQPVGIGRIGVRVVQPDRVHEADVGGAAARSERHGIHTVQQQVHGNREGLLAAACPANSSMSPIVVCR